MMPQVPNPYYDPSDTSDIEPKFIDKLSSSFNKVDKMMQKEIVTTYF